MRALFLSLLPPLSLSLSIVIVIRIWVEYKMLLRAHPKLGDQKTYKNYYSIFKTFLSEFQIKKVLKNHTQSPQKQWKKAEFLISHFELSSEYC